MVSFIYQVALGGIGPHFIGGARRRILMKEVDHDETWKVDAVILLALFCVAFLGVPSSPAALEVKMSYNGPADEENNAVHLYAVNFKKLVEEGTGGAVMIKLFPDSQLGNEEERMELLTKKGMNQPIINVASFAGVAPVFPEIYASAVPFMFDSFEAAHFFFDESRYWERAKEEFHQRTGAYLLEAVEEGGFLAFTNDKRQIRTAEDFKGLRFRGMDEGQVILESFGASGTPIPWTELYMALKSGVVDGQMTSPRWAAFTKSRSTLPSPTSSIQTNSSSSTVTSSTRLRRNKGRPSPKRRGKPIR